MGKLLKISLSLLSGLLVLLIFGAIAVVIIVDPNDYKPEIEAAVQENLNRTLVIEGDLELSVFPWIGLSTGKMTVSNAPGFNDIPFAAIGSSDIKVKLFPLLSKKLEVKKIVLQELVLNLEKNRQGITNWDDLSKPEEQSSEVNGQNQSQIPEIAAIALGGLTIENSRLVWDDQKAGAHNEIVDLNLNLDAVKFNQPFSMDLSFKILGIQPELSQSISLSTNLIINETLDKISLEKLKIQSIAEGREIPAGKLEMNARADINLNLTSQTALIKDLQVQSKDLILNAELSGVNIQDKPVFSGPVSIEQFSPRDLFRQLKIKLPPISDKNALKAFSMLFSIQADADSIQLNDINMNLDDTRLTGSATIQNFSQPGYDFNFAIDQINLDRYLPTDQPVSEQTKPSDNEPTAATPATTVAAGVTLIPVDVLKKLKAKGQLRINKIQFNKINMQGLQLNISADKGVLNTKQTITDVYKGTYNGLMNIDVTGKQPSLSLNEKLSNVHIQPLLQAKQSKIHMTGTASGSAKLHARGNSVQDIKSSLNGLINFILEDGVVKGFNFKKIIKSATSLIEGKPLPKKSNNDQTAFSIIKGKILLDNGIANNNDLLAEAPDLRVTGNGNANLINEQLNYKIVGRLIKNRATATEPEKIEGVPAHINITGTFSNPVYTPNVIAMLKDKSNPEIEKKKQKLLDKVDKKFGTGAKDLLKQFF